MLTEADEVHRKHLSCMFDIMDILFKVKVRKKHVLLLCCFMTHLPLHLQFESQIGDRRFPHLHPTCIPYYLLTLFALFFSMLVYPRAKFLSI